MTEDNIRYEVNHNGEVVPHNSTLCQNIDSMLLNLFSQYNWHCKLIETKGSYLKLLLKSPIGDEKYLNIFKGNIRNEKRNPYEKKIQLGVNINPLDYDKHNTIILGVYVYEEHDELRDAIFISFPINKINYTTNPSLRGVQTNKIIQEAKNKGFVHDKESNNIGFRPEFIFYYLDNFYYMHYSSLLSDNSSNSITNKELTPEWFKEQAKKYTKLDEESKQVRESFIKEFHPDRLKELSNMDLLNKMFLNGSKDNLCYILEYDTKNQSLFGNIKKDSSKKFGLYFNENWKTSPENILTEEQAVNRGTQIRDNIIKGAGIIEQHKNQELNYNLYKEIFDNINSIDGLNKIWVLKYYQMLYPDLLPTFYNDEWINKILEILGIEPLDNRFLDMGQISMFIKKCGISNTVFAQICYDFLQNTEELEPYKEIKEEAVYNSSYSWNRIIFGAPGTGKSYKLKDDKNKLLENGGYCERVTFHPDYSYANFVGTYKPVPSKDAENNECITYKYVPGPFMRTLVKALKNKNNGILKPYLLIIEEINRANMAAVFGDIFQLLDRNENGYSEYPIQASEDIKKYLSSELGGEPNNYNKLQIPTNMFIWATMNSADQGVYPMDTAFKRRWDFEYISIDHNEKQITFKNVKLGEGDNVKEFNWNNLRKAINDHLTSLKINEDKLLGPYFISKNILQSDDESFKTAFKNKVLMYLFEDAAKHKRTDIFAAGLSKYSSICEEFDKKGIDIFCDKITSKVKIIEKSQIEDSK